MSPTPRQHDVNLDSVREEEDGKKKQEKAMWFKLNGHMFKLRSATRWTSGPMARREGSFAERVRKIKVLEKPQLGSGQCPRERNKRKKKRKKS